MTDEMKAFLQEGLHNYAPAFVAISEFRRQVRMKLQAVLDESAPRFEELGLDVEGFKLQGPKLDDLDLDEKHSWIQLKKNHGTELYSGYSVAWNFSEPPGQQLWVEAWIYAGRVRGSRDRLFGLLKKHQSRESKSDLEQYSDGSPSLSAYCDENAFYDFDIAFRALIEEWIEMLSKADLKAFLSASTVG